jgi:plastocyanin
MSSSDSITRDDERTRVSAAVARDLPASPARPIIQNRPGIDYYRNGREPQTLHLAVVREKDELAAGREPLSLWLISFFAVVLFAAAFYFGRYSGHFSADSLDPVPSATDSESASTPSLSTATKTSAEVPRPADGQPAVIRVVIRNMQFAPAKLEIRKGDTVEWANDDLTPHTATSPQFDSGSIEPDKSWRHTFTTAGEFPYSCTFHPDMKATVAVKE